MTISKQVNNTGGAGGHGMTEIDIKRELKKQQDELLDEFSSRECSCPLCGEQFVISPKNTNYQGQVLETKFKKEGCPFCKLDKDGRQRFGYAVENKFKLIRYSFVINDNYYNKIYTVEVLRKPQGYKKGKFFKEEVDI